MPEEPKELKHTSLDIDQAAWRRLKVVAALLDASMSSVFNECLAEGLAKRELQLKDERGINVIQNGN